jgi:hypothetical protein
LQQEFLEDVVARLEGTGVTYAITGSIAGNVWGVPRLTHDVDVLVLLPADKVADVVAAFPDPYYVSELAIQDALRTGTMFNVLDTGAGLKADFWVSRGDPFSQSMLSRRRRVEILPGREAHVGSAEDVLLSKLVWYKITPSDRQLADAAGIAAVQAGKLDLTYLRQWAAAQTTATLLEEVLQGRHLKNT